MVMPRPILFGTVLATSPIDSRIDGDPAVFSRPQRRQADTHVVH